jgi:arylformamidase
MPPRIVDLSLTLRRGMRGVEWETACTFERDGWNSRNLHLYSHAGTHMDAPVHFAAGPQSIDQIPLDSFMGPAWVADLPGIAPRSLIELAHLGDLPAKFQPGESLILRTGWSRFVEEPAVYRDGLPRLSEGLARWCVSRKVKMIGIEPPSVAEIESAPEVTRIHQILLSGGVVIVEGLANLEALQKSRIFFIALPLKIEGGDGSPCRALAVEDESWTLNALRT